MKLLFGMPILFVLLQSNSFANVKDVEYDLFKKNSGTELVSLIVKKTVIQTKEPIHKIEYYDDKPLNYFLENFENITLNEVDRFNNLPISKNATTYVKMNSFVERKSFNLSLINENNINYVELKDISGKTLMLDEKIELSNSEKIVSKKIEQENGETKITIFSIISNIKNNDNCNSNNIVSRKSKIMNNQYIKIYSNADCKS